MVCDQGSTGTAIVPQDQFQRKQDKETLQQRGDKLDNAIRSIEREIYKVQKVLNASNAHNEDTRKKSTRSDVDPKELEQRDFLKQVCAWKGLVW